MKFLILQTNIIFVLVLEEMAGHSNQFSSQAGFPPSLQEAQQNNMPFSYSGVGVAGSYSTPQSNFGGTHVGRDVNMVSAERMRRQEFDILGDANPGGQNSSVTNSLTQPFHHSGDLQHTNFAQPVTDVNGKTLVYDNVSMYHEPQKDVNGPPTSVAEVYGKQIKLKKDVELEGDIPGNLSDIVKRYLFKYKKFVQKSDVKFWKPSDAEFAKNSSTVMLVIKNYIPWQDLSNIDLAMHWSYHGQLVERVIAQSRSSAMSLLKRSIVKGECCNKMKFSMG